MPRVTRKVLFLTCTSLLIVALLPSLGLLVDLVLDVSLSGPQLKPSLCRLLVLTWLTKVSAGSLLPRGVHTAGLLRTLER